MQPDPTASPSPTLVIVEGPGLVRDALAVALAHTFTTLRVDPADTPRDGILGAVLETEPDVVLLSFTAASRLDTERLIGQLTARAARVVAIAPATGQDAPAIRRRWSAAGAAAVVTGDSGLPALVEALSCASRGLASDERAGGPRSHRAAEARRKLSALTSDEQDVLAALATGATFVEVAQLRGIAEVVVRAHVRSILAKLEVGSVLAALGIAQLSTPPTG
jgi:two-component system nitrate/nitrite response regulator NarL